MHIVRQRVADDNPNSFDIGHYNPQGGWEHLANEESFGEAMDICNVLNGGCSHSVLFVSRSIDELKGTLDTIARQFGFGLTIHKES